MRLVVSAFLSVVLLGGASLAACGASTPEDGVIQIGRTFITRSTVAHWMSVIAGEGATAPVPQPPRYEACIKYRRSSSSARTSGSSGPTSLELRRECEFDFQKYKLKALYFLISYDWVVGEASELGVRLGDGEPMQQLTLLQSKSPDARRFLVGSRGTTADELMRIKLSLLTMKIQQSLEKQSAKARLTGPERQRALDRFGLQFRRKWTARTSCHGGYVVPICREYETPKVAPALVPPSIPLTNMTTR